jgi:hypothetical protein
MFGYAWLERRRGDPIQQSAPAAVMLRRLIEGPFQEHHSLARQAAPFDFGLLGEPHA